MIHLPYFLVKVNESSELENINSTKLKSTEKTAETFSLNETANSGDVPDSE